MDFISAIKTGWSWVTGKSVAAALTRTVLLGYALNKLNSSKKDNPSDGGGAGQQPDPGVKVQVEANTRNKIPVLYGEAFVAGKITDAVMTNNNQTMWYCVTISETTGTKLSDSLASSYILEDVYWNDQRIIFTAFGRDINYTIDRDGNIDRSLQNRVSIFFYAGGSASSYYLTPDNYTADPTPPNAWTIMPDWTSNHTMNDLIFAIVRVDYDRERGVNGLGNLVFHLKNSMELPGDCIYDYMTNNKYGAGIDPAEIYSG